jgi:uncharacterized membrane protein YphA (DoxX/SURF4 family)
MLSLLPQLFSYQIIAFAILRITIAVIGFIAGVSRYKKEYKWVSILYFVVSIFLLLGLYTQVVALVAIVLVCFNYWTDKKTSTSTAEQKLLHIVCIVVLLSLLFTGPGFLAIDKPL